jgi:putative ABC transport system permease protein
MKWWQLKNRDTDLERELQSDLDLEEEEQQENGLPPEEAHYAARRAFGNATLIKEQTHEAWGWVAFEHFFRDLRYALRQLGRSPGFTSAAILTLALGIGATTAMFSLVNAVLLRPLPFPEQDRLMWLAQQDHSLPGVASEALSYPDYFDWRAQNRTFSGMASYAGGGIALELKGESQRLEDQTVSSNFFQVLGVAPMLGRDFRWDDEKLGNRTVMLSYSLWQSAFGGARDIAGKSVTMDGRNYTVAGVMPKGFQFPVENPGPALWISIADDAEGKKTGQRGFDVLRVIGRLKPGVSVEQAKADLSIIAGNLAMQYPDTNKQYGSALVKPELEQLTGDTRPAMRVLFGAVTLVLLMVCANVAGLLLARGSRRNAEFALRAAIGASRAAIIRQLLVESATLSLGGGAAGVALAWWLVNAAVKLMPLDIPRMQDASIDGSVLLFDLTLSLLTGILFGVLPAWRLSRSMPAQALRDGSRTVTGGGGRNRVHNGLVVAQTAIGLVLLLSSGLLIRSFIRILNVDPGFDPRHVLSARAGASFNKMKHDQHIQFFDEVLKRISAIPGVQSASAGWPLPMSDGNASISFNIQGRPIARGDEPSEELGLAMPGYFETMRIPLISGRTFGEQDGAKGTPTIIINQAFANKYFRGENPLGHHIQVRLGDDVFVQSIREIVGVVGDTKLKKLTAGAEPQDYLPFAQAVVTNPFFVVRTSGDPAIIQDAIRAAVQGVDQSVPVYQVSTLEDYISKSAAQPRFQTFVLTGFAAIALVLAAIGLYGLLSYMVVQRTLEIGLRMAMGAQRSDVLRMIVRRGLTMALIGVLTGLAISALMLRLLSGLLYGIRLSDPITFAGTIGLLLTVSVVASIVPAYRAARLDPIQTLREQ